LLGVVKATVGEVVFDEDDGVIVAVVTPHKGEQGRCGVCQRKSPRYDDGEGLRRWRTLDLGSVQAYVEAPAPRVRCREHGVKVASVPWARHGAGHTLAFDDMVAWLAVACSKSAVTELLRVGWRTVGAIITRVCADAEAVGDRFAGLRRIGIDEISYKRHHKYLIVVVDHDTGRLVWAAPGRDNATMAGFFDVLGPQRCARITHVSADGARWISSVVAQRCPQAVLCADPFHVVGWAGEALDVVRRAVWNDARREVGGSVAGTGGHGGRAVVSSAGEAKVLKQTRWALWKNPENLTEHQREALVWIAKTSPRLHRAYLLKEGLRLVFSLSGEAAVEALGRWISWARRCRIGVFVVLARKIVKHRDAIHATLRHGLSNGLVESTNTKIRVLTRVAFGFKDPQALVALAMLALGGLRPKLPNRTHG
jgi:transposase